MKRLVSELKAQTEENTAEREQLAGIWDRYDEKFAQHTSLEETNRELQAQVQSLGSNTSNSKQHVIGLLGQRASAADQETRAIEKNLVKGQIDLREFLDNYVKQRSEYHKYQLLKVKVHQS